MYQDHLTKFVILKPLKSKSAEEVAYHLVDIFTLIGAPSILQSDNGREFSNNIVNNLKEYWPTLRIVHGKPRHSQSQGSVERANQDVENMISTWMQDEKTNRWSEGLRFVQLMKNRALHSGIKRTPYEALFGCKVKVGLTTSSLPQDVLDGIQSEEDLERIVNNIHTTEPQPAPPSLVPTSQTDQTTSEVNEAAVAFVSTSNSTEEIATTQNLPRPLHMCSVCSQQTNDKQNCAKCSADIHIKCGHVIKAKTCDDSTNGDIDNVEKKTVVCFVFQHRKYI